MMSGQMLFLHFLRLPMIDLYHQKAHDAAKKHGTNSSQYKSAAKAAHTASKDAHDSHVDFETIKRDHPNKNLTIKRTH